VSAPAVRWRSRYLCADCSPRDVPLELRRSHSTQGGGGGEPALHNTSKVNYVVIAAETGVKFPAAISLLYNSIIRIRKHRVVFCLPVWQTHGFFPSITVCQSSVSYTVCGEYLPRERANKFMKGDKYPTTATPCSRQRVHITHGIVINKNVLQKRSNFSNVHWPCASDKEALEILPDFIDLAAVTNWLVNALKIVNLTI
jgi:hypothetical protein